MADSAPDYSAPSTVGGAYSPDKPWGKRGETLLKSKGLQSKRGKAQPESEDWDSLPVALWKLSPEGIVLKTNRTNSELLGFVEQEVIGKSVVDFFVDAADVKMLLDRAFTLGRLTKLSTRLRCKDGSTRDVMIDASPVDLGSVASEIHCAVSDRATQRRTEDYVREQAEFFSKSEEAVILQTLDGLVTFWSQGAERLYGLQARFVVGRKIPEQLAMDSTQTAHAMDAVLTQGEWFGTLRHYSASGSELEIESRWSLVRDSKGLPRSVLIINADAAVAKLMDDALLRAQRQECIGTLASGIAHDLNNIFQPISIALDLFRSRLADTESQEMLEVMDSNLRRATELVRQILTFTSGGRGERRSVEITPIFNDIANFVRQAFPKTIHFHSIIDKSVHPALGDLTQIEQVLLNLCVNARDAMPDGGLLLLKAENVIVDEEAARRESHAQPGSYVRLTVSDTGVGIPPALQKKIFEPFFTTKSPGKGTGLGLATALGIIRSHNGFLALDTEEGKGSSFHAFFPAAQKKVRPLVPLVLPHRAGDLKGSGESILLVDDEVTVLKVMQRSLEKSGYRILTAENGEKGVSLYAQHHQDIRLVITDLAMPGMDGTAMISTLKKIDPLVKIICTSGLNTTFQLDSLSALGVHAVLAKPCNSQSILQAIKETLAAPLPVG
jgi:PAS domain S-box-containing protein